MKQFSQMLQQAQQMQQKMADIQAQMEMREFEGSAGAGMVKVTVNGKNQVIKVSIDKSLVTPDDVEMLEDLILAATNDAQEKAGRIVSEEMSKVTSGLKLPGGFSLPF